MLITKREITLNWNPGGTPRAGYVLTIPQGTPINPNSLDGRGQKVGIVATAKMLPPEQRTFYLSGRRSMFAHDAAHRYVYVDLSDCEEAPERCTYPECKCIVSTSTSDPEPTCPKGLPQ